MATGGAPLLPLVLAMMTPEKVVLVLSPPVGSRLDPKLPKVTVPGVTPPSDNEPMVVADELFRASVEAVSRRTGTVAGRSLLPDTATVPVRIVSPLNVLPVLPNCSVLEPFFVMLPLETTPFRVVVLLLQVIERLPPVKSTVPEILRAVPPVTPKVMLPPIMVLMTAGRVRVAPVAASVALLPERVRVFADTPNALLPLILRTPKLMVTLPEKLLAALEELLLSCHVSLPFLTTETAPPPPSVMLATD